MAQRLLLYQNYCDPHYGPLLEQVELADLTHDGWGELIVVLSGGQMEMHILGIYSVC